MFLLQQVQLQHQGPIKRRAQRSHVVWTTHRTCVWIWDTTLHSWGPGSTGPEMHSQGQGSWTGRPIKPRKSPEEQQLPEDRVLSTSKANLQSQHQGNFPQFWTFSPTQLFPPCGSNRHEKKRESLILHLNLHSVQFHFLQSVWEHKKWTWVEHMLETVKSTVEVSILGPHHISPLAQTVYVWGGCMGCDKLKYKFIYKPNTVCVRALGPISLELVHSSVTGMAGVTLTPSFHEPLPNITRPVWRRVWFPFTFRHRAVSRLTVLQHLTLVVSEVWLTGELGFFFHRARQKNRGVRKWDGVKLNL